MTLMWTLRHKRADVLLLLQLLSTWHDVASTQTDDADVLSMTNCRQREICPSSPARDNPPFHRAIIYSWIYYRSLHHFQGQRSKVKVTKSTKLLWPEMRTERPTKFKLGTQMEYEDPYHRQYTHEYYYLRAPVWRSKVKGQSHRVDWGWDQKCVISSERKGLRNSNLVWWSTKTRIADNILMNIIIDPCTSFKVKGQRSRSRSLMLRPEFRHIFRTERPTKFKLDLQMEYDNILMNILWIRFRFFWSFDRAESYSLPPTVIIILVLCMDMSQQSACHWPYWLAICLQSRSKPLNYGISLSEYILRISKPRRLPDGNNLKWHKDFLLTTH